MRIASVPRRAETCKGYGPRAAEITRRRACFGREQVRPPEPRNARHQVTIFRDNILVSKVGNPDCRAWG